MTNEIPTGRWRHVSRRWFRTNILVLQIEVTQRREYLDPEAVYISTNTTWRDATTADLTIALSPSPLTLQPEKCPEKSPSENQMKPEPEQCAS